MSTLNTAVYGGIIVLKYVKGDWNAEMAVLMARLMVDVVAENRDVPRNRLIEDKA